MPPPHMNTDFSILRDRAPVVGLAVESGPHFVVIGNIPRKELVDIQSVKLEELLVGLSTNSRPFPAVGIREGMQTSKNSVRPLFLLVRIRLRKQEMREPPK